MTRVCWEREEKYAFITKERNTMDVHRAKELLTILADGVDPLTGEVLPEDHVLSLIHI